MHWSHWSVRKKTTRQQKAMYANEMTREKDHETERRKNHIEKEEKKSIEKKNNNQYRRSLTESKRYFLFPIYLCVF